MDSAEEAFRVIESCLDQTLRGARDAFKAIGIDIVDWSDRSGRDAYSWAHSFEWVVESEGVLRRVEVSLSYLHPWTAGDAPPVTLSCRGEVFHRGSGLDLRSWRASSVVRLDELDVPDGLVALVEAWILRGKTEIGQAP